MRELQTSLAAFDSLVERARECTDNERAMALASELAKATHQLRLQLGECVAARAVQQTCDFAQLVLAGGARREDWLAVLDVDFKRTRWIAQCHLDSREKQLLAR